MVINLIKGISIKYFINIYYVYEVYKYIIVIKIVRIKEKLHTL